MRPSFFEEKKLWKKGYECVAGLDEAGVGPLAGPVVAAAVTINQKSNINLDRRNPEGFHYGASKPAEGSFYGYSRPVPSRPRGEIDAGNEKLKIILREIRDSKQLTPKKREKLYKLIIKNPAVRWGIGVVSEKTIDKINIKNAAELAMERALKQLEKRLGRKADFLIVDGRGIKNSKLKARQHKTIVKADERVFSCAAASIIAKVTRDRIMQKLHQKYPPYRFDKHKGYPTALHRKMLKRYGVSTVHRRSFGPVASIYTKKAKP